MEGVKKCGWAWRWGAGSRERCLHIPPPTANCFVREDPPLGINKQFSAVFCLKHIKVWKRSYCGGVSMGLEVCWGGGMKAALERSRDRGRETAVSISGRKKPVAYTHWVEEKEQGDRQQKTAHFHSFHFENVIVSFKSNQEWVHTV